MRELAGLLALLLGCGTAQEGLPSASAGDGTGSTTTTTGSTGSSTLGGTAGESASSDTGPSTSTGTGSTTTVDVDTEASTSSTSSGTSGAGSTGPDTTGGSAPCTGLVWEIDFTMDPTSVDVNGDLVPDWTLRNGAPFPDGELVGGVWQAGTHQPLDTRPLDDFVVPMRVIVEMRSVETGSTHGATFWVNADYDGGTFAPIFIALNLDANGTQDLQLFGRSGASTNVLLHQELDLSADFVRIELDIDPATDSVALTLDDAYIGSYTYPTFGPPNADRFATVFAWETDAEFRYARVEQCPD